MKYLLDANVFIQAKRFHYPFDIFPGFWEWLQRDMENGKLISVEPIYKELIVGNDELKEWTCHCNECGCFLSIDDRETQNRFREVAAWATDPEQQFKPYAIDEFLQIGDSWLVAKAISINATVVTHETYDPACKKRVKIPNVCLAFSVPYINTIELIRRNGAKFGLV